MSTTTVIERMPLNWDSSDGMGDWGDQNPGAAWRAAFDEYLTKNYPHCSLVGNEIYGPATYRFNGLNMQKNTPKLSELKSLPDNGIYEEFQELHQDDFFDVIDQYIE